MIILLLKPTLKTQNAKRDVSINKEVYELIRKIPVKENGYILVLAAFNSRNN